MAGVWWWRGWSMVHLVLIVNPCHKISAACSELGTADTQTKETPDSHHNTTHRDAYMPLPSPMMNASNEMI